MKTAVRNSLLLVIAVAALVAGYAASRWLFQPVADAATTSMLVDFSLPDTAGNQHSASEWRGKPLVLNFWATWCEPCREEVPFLINAQKRYQARGLQIVGVAIDDTDSVMRFAQDMRINYPLLIAQEAGLELMSRYGNRRGLLPFTVIIDPDGTVLARKLGGYSKRELAEALDSLVNAHSSTILSK